MNDINFGAAPKSATHYIEKMGTVFWCQYIGDILYMFDTKEGWVQTRLWPNDELLAIPSNPLRVTISEFQPFTSIEDAQPATAKQPAPNGSGNPILGMVLADLTNRALEGKQKYGEPLKANNGRNALWDAYQEALDLAMYLRQAIEEQSK